MISDDGLIRYVTRHTDQRLTAERGLPTAELPSGHRELMTMIKNAICCWLNPHSRWHHSPEAAAAADDWLPTLAGRQDDNGLFSSSGNVSSPPDSSFSVNDVAAMVLLLRDHGALPGVREQLETIIDRVTDGLVSGGVHTPNHRWEIASALARVDAVRPSPQVRNRIADWLAEGIDVDADGVYSERSANYAAHVSNPSLLTLADLLGRDDLTAIVHRNLHAQAALTGPDGLVETIFSRRQDQKLLDHRTHTGGFDLGAFLLQYRRFAHDCPTCAEVHHRLLARELGATRPVVDPTMILAELLTREPEHFAATAAATVDRDQQSDRRGVGVGAGVGTDAGSVRVFERSGVATIRNQRSLITVYGGSDVASTGRISSGLACNPTFLRWRFADLALDSVRLSRDFFGLGPFRATGLEQHDERTFVLSEQLVGSYYHPLLADQQREDGDYDLEHEGRFAARMSFSRRAHDDVMLTTVLTVTVEDDTIRLRAVCDGPPTRCCFEFGFRPGGELVGGEPLDTDRRLFSPGAGYRVGDRMISLNSSTSESGPASAAFYQPGEAYTFLAGTDAVGGPRLYLPVAAPTDLELTITASS